MKQTTQHIRVLKNTHFNGRLGLIGSVSDMEDSGNCLEVKSMIDIILILIENEELHREGGKREQHSLFS